jgi:type IV pilus assembly protein PilV
MTRSARSSAPRRPNPPAPPARFPRPDAAGFTLVEVLVAMIIFAVGLLSIATLMPSGSRSVGRSADQTRGSELAAACAERVLTTSYSDSTLSAGTHLDPANPYEGKYYLRWTVEDDQPMAMCKRATVSASWPTAAATPGASVVVVIPRSGG